MTIPLIAPFTLGALTVTSTLRIPPNGAEHPDHAQVLLLEVVGSDTPDWTLAIQGRTHPNGTFTAVDYVQIFQAGAAAVANTTLTVNDTTRRFYVIPLVAPFMQVVATRTTGTLTILGSYSSEPFSQWLKTTARGSIFAEGPVASGGASTGNPVLAGFRADTTIPTAVDDGDVVEGYSDEYGRLHVSISEGGSASEETATISAAADAKANPTTLDVLSHLHGLRRGTATWDRLVSVDDSANGLDTGALMTAPVVRDTTDAAFYPVQAPRGVADNYSGAALLGIHPWLYDGANFDKQLSVTGAGASSVAGIAAVGGYMYSGVDSTWVRRPANDRTAYLASAARTGDTNGADRTNYEFRGLIIFLNVSAVGAPAGSITMRVQAKDETTGNYINVYSAAAAVASTGQRAYIVYPIAENTEGWTETFAGMLPGLKYRVILDHANESDSITYSVDLIELR